MMLSANLPDACGTATAAPLSTQDLNVRLKGIAFNALLSQATAALDTQDAPTSPTLQARQRALAVLNDTPAYPSPTEELWRFTPVRELVGLPLWQAEVQVQTDAPGVLCAPLDAAWPQLSPAQQDVLAKRLADETLHTLSAGDHFWQMANRLAAPTYVVAIPQQAAQAGLCRVQVAVDARQAPENTRAYAPIRLLVVAEANAQPVVLSVEVTAQAASGVPVLCQPVCHATVGEGSAVSLHVVPVDAAHGALEVMSHTHAEVAAGAKFNTLYFNADTRLARHGGWVKLVGEGAECRLHGLSLLHERQGAYHHLRVEHLAPAAVSHQLFKQVLGDQAEAEFAGAVWVSEQGQQADAQQLSRSLVLDDGAKALARPWLQIDADDVTCSHGATVGQLEEDQLFYLMSRGLTRDVASRMLLKGFVHEVIDAYGEATGVAAETLAPILDGLHARVDAQLDLLVHTLS